MLRWMDNFSAYGTDASYLTNGPYAEVLNLTTLEADPDPNATGTVLRCGAITSGWSGIRKVLPSSQATVGIAFRIWLENLPVGESRPTIEWRDSSNNVVFFLTINTIGEIIAYRGSSTANEVGRSSGPIIIANGWQHIEAKRVASASVGEIEVRVDGFPAIELTGVDTGATSTGQVLIGSIAGGAIAPVAYYKDFVLWDGSGSINNDFIGSCSVINLTPNADVSLGGWAPSTGSTGWDLIDESPPNDDTDYISADDTPPAAASFEMSNLPIDVTSVKGVMTMVRMRKTDGGDGTVQVSLISDGVTGSGTDRAITVAYTYWTDMFETDPATAGVWTPAAVDAVQIKIDRTT